MGWRHGSGNRLGFHLWRFLFHDFGFTHRLDVKFDVLNHIFSNGFDNHVSGFFDSGCWLSVLRDVLCDNRVFFSNELRCGFNRCSNHFRVRGFDINGLWRRFNFLWFNDLRLNFLWLNDLRFDNGSRLHRDVFYGGDGCDNLFGDSLFFNSLLRTGNRIADRSTPPRRGPT